VSLKLVQGKLTIVGGLLSTSPAQASASDADEITREPMSRIRRLIAQRLVKSLQTSAQLTTVIEADVTAIAELRTKYKDQFAARVGMKLSFLPFFAIAAIEALERHRVVNATLDLESTFIEYHRARHLGIAVDTDRGLIVPVVRDAGNLTLAELTVGINDLAARARANRLSPAEVAGGTFTITNTGSRGALFDTPIVNAPQAAILGTGAVVRRVVPSMDDSGRESVAIRSMAYLSLSYDHRLIDGADAARFLSDVKARLEEGDFVDSLTG
jgi:pyruvate dehydrogenase E2 component (dihydrolipoamide acetyltransferase)